MTATERLQQLEPDLSQSGDCWPHTIICMCTCTGVTDPTWPVPEP